MPPVSASLSARDDETLDRYAAAGGMAPDRIRRILADLAVSLQELHRAGRAHGGIAPSTIGLDAAGRAHLLAPPLAPAANAEDARRHEGYAAFEQYTDDPDTPCGPWTDIYALSATACALLTGLAPPAALARCVRDEYLPLAQRRGPDEQAFCAVLDSGLAMDAYARPQTIDEFARALRLDMPAQAIERTPAMAPDEPPTSLEDADGLEPIPDTDQAIAGQASRIALYREGRMARAQAAAAEAPARDPAAAQYEAAVASFHTRADPQPPRPGREQPQASAPRQRPPGKPRPRQGAPRLMTLAVCIMIATALYVWLRPPPPPRIKSVARASSTAPSATTPATAPVSNASTPNTSVSNTSGSNASASTTAPPATSAPGTSSSNAQASNTPAPYNPASNNATSSPQAPGSAPSGAPVADGASSAPTATAPAPSGTEPSGNTLASTASGGSSAATDNSKGGGSGENTIATPVASDAPAASSDAKSATSSDAKPATLSDAKPGASGTPADTAGKPHPAPAGKTPVPVSVAIRPWGEILVNGKSRGVSPPLNSLTLAPGTYAITIRNNAGPDIHQNLTITAGKSAAISHTFK